MKKLFNELIYRIRIYLSLLIILFLTSCKEKCNLCPSGDILLSQYDTIYPNTQPGQECDYIILKKKPDSTNEKNHLNGYFSSTKMPIDTIDAARAIQLYNEKFNPDLSNTAFIDLNREELMLYLIDVSVIGQRLGDKSNIFRVYLANRVGDKDSVSAIITTVVKNREIYQFDKALIPIDWGSLCPPPYPCIANKNANLLRIAIDSSETLPKTEREWQERNKPKPAPTDKTKTPKSISK